MKMLTLLLMAMLLMMPLVLSQEPAPSQDFIGWLFNSITGLWEQVFGGDVIQASESNLGTGINEQDNLIVDWEHTRAGIGSNEFIVTIKQKSDQTKSRNLTGEFILGELNYKADDKIDIYELKNITHPFTDYYECWYNITNCTEYDKIDIYKCLKSKNITVYGKDVSCGSFINDNYYFDWELYNPKSSSKTSTEARKELNFIELPKPSLTANNNNEKKFKVIVYSPITKINNGFGSTGTFVLNLSGNEFWDKSNSSWWNNSWTYRKNITVDNTNMQSNLTDFPLYVYFNDSDIGASALTTGNDIRFAYVDSAGDAIEIPYEKESFTIDGGGYASGIFWVKTNLTNTTATSTKIQVYYGNTTASAGLDGEQKTKVWDSNYVGVWHLIEQGGGTTGEYKDSTANSYNATGSSGYFPTLSTDANIYKSQSFDFNVDNGEAINFPDMRGKFTDIDTGTWSFWIKADNDPSTDNGYGALGILGTGGAIDHYPYTNSNIYLGIGRNDRLNLGDIGISDMTVWHYVTITNKNEANNWIFYQNAVSQYTTAGVALFSINQYSSLSQKSSLYYWLGHYEEVRLSNVVRSPAWIKFEFENMNQTDNELNYGAEETGEAPPSDTIYPLFSNYLDNNGTLLGTGTGLFNVTVANTNGTVILHINGTNILASNLSANVYNASHTFTSSGTYNYNWTAYGNGTSHNLNTSQIQSYTVNASADTSYPLFTNNQTYPANNTQYTPNGIWQFNITIANTNGTASIDFNNVNYSMSNLTTVFNKTFTNLAKGIYPYYYWAYGNGTSKLFNFSETWYYTIAINNSVVLGLTATTPIIYPAQTDFTGSNCPAQLIGSCSLNITNGVFGVGTVSANYSTVGNANYSATSNSSTVTINQNSTYNMTILGVTPITYGSQAGISNSSCPSQITCVLNRNDTGAINSPDNSILPIGFYNYTFNTTGNTNYSARSTSFVLQVQKNNTPCDIMFNATTPQTYPYLFKVFTNCTSDFYITRNGTIIANNSEQVLSAGSYNFTVFRNDTANYTNIIDTEDFTITQATPVITKLLNGGTANLTLVYPQQVNATGSSTGGTIKIFRNETDVTSENGLNQTLGVGGYIYKFNVTGNTNYSGLTGEYMQVNITSAVDITPPYFTTIPSDISASYPYNLGVDFNADDETGFGYYKINDTRFFINQSGWLNTTVNLGVANYFINVSINDTSGNLNSTVFNINITQNNTYVLSLAITPATTVTYPVETTATGSGCPTEIVCNLSNNVTGFLVNPSIDTLGVRIYNYTFNSSGNTNYSIKSISGLLTVNQNTSAVVYTYLNHTRANITINNNTAIYLNGTLFNVTGVVNLYKNGTLIGFNTTRIGNLTDFNGTGIYNITAIYEGNINYSRASETWYVNVTAVLGDTTPPYFTNNTPVNQTITYGNSLSYDINASDETALSCFAVNDTRFNIDCDGLLQNVTSLGVNLYYLNITINDTSNNLNSTVMWVNVTKASVPLTFKLNGVAGDIAITYPQQVNASAYTSTNQIIVISRDDGGGAIDVSAENSINVTLGANTIPYDYIALAQANQNYSDYGIGRYLTVNKATGLINGTINGTQGNFTAVNGTATLNIYINATNMTGYGTGKIYVNGTLYNFGTLPIFNQTNLPSGFYNITFVYDGNGNYTDDNETWWVNITLPDTTPPYFTGIGNVEMYDNQSLSYDINATDETAFGFFAINWTTVFSINKNTGVLTNVSGLGIGIYYINVSINDTTGNMNSSVMWVNVSNSTVPTPPDTTKPVFTNCRNFNHTVNTSFSQSITATDNVGISSYFLNDTTNFTVNSGTGLITNFSSLTIIKTYWLNLTVNDTSNNMKDCIFYIDVIALGTSKCAGNFTTLKIPSSNNRPYIKLCNALDFR